LNTPWRCTQEKVKQIDKMNAVGKCDSGIWARALEAAEPGPQDFESAKSPLVNLIAQP
jgi:hypothetical protein